ncbi:MAG: AMP-dependent synthetase/ligase [Actinomycetota bacterium]|nr:AMP-dependent synthetase/ligase [Actinomycetota bacterium]
MQEYATPPLLELPATATLLDTPLKRARTAPDAPAFARRSGAGWENVSAAAFAGEVTALAAGLVARGVQPGDRVGLMSRTRYEWTLCDYAIWVAGAVTVPVYETSSAEQLRWIAQDSGAVALVLEGERHRQVWDEVAAELPEVRAVVEIDAGGLDELRAAGAGVDPGELERRRAALTADDLATVIYTSGTTGQPKGCELTHRNLLAQARSTGVLLPQILNDRGTTLQFLPLAHVFARWVQVACVENRVQMGHSADITALLPDLAALRPTFLLSVPRVFEKIYNGSKQRAHAEGKGRIFDAAESTAIAYSTALDGRGPSLALRLRHAVFDRLVFTRLRAAMGGRVAYAVSGGAPLGARLGHFFRGAGITVLEGYGLTETSAPSTVNTPDAIRVGTVGRPLPGVRVRIADDGEILIAGDHLFQGYWRNERATAETLADGWLRTGDLGALDDDGFLSITGRKKEILVTAAGKNVAPAVLEDRLRAHPLVDQCMVVGDRRPFVACLVTLDVEAAKPWLKARGRPEDVPRTELVRDPDVLAELQRAVDDANRAVSQAESIRKFVVLDAEWSEQGGQLTPSLKLKRSVVLEEFADDVEGLYRDARR